MAVLLVLTGFMGSGKSAVGTRAAVSLGWDFIDLDDVVEEREGASVAQIFAEMGEGGFRRAELGALEAIVEGLPERGNTILSLGGGTLGDDTAVSLLREHAFVVYLDTPVDLCWQRVGSDADRPLAQNRAAFSELAASREGQYEAAADVVIEAEERDVDELAAQIVALARALEGEPGP